MKKLHFAYDMQIEYSMDVVNCNFTIKCIPQNTLRQKIEDIQIKLDPETDYQWGEDGLGNVKIWGVNRMAHRSFRFQIEGDATTGLCDYEAAAEENLAMLFAHPHGLNVAGDTILKWYHDKIENIETNKNIESNKTCIYDKVLAIMELLYRDYRYQSGVTTVDTSAEEAFAQGCGVCQDYAHIMISLLHLAKIPARYVTGFIIGEGQSHAWVEFLDQGKWYGVDPTHCRPIGDDYIRIGHGRDAKDCMLNRGIMHGGGQHIQKVDVRVHEQ